MISHVILIPFSVVGLGLASLDPGWLGRRIKIFEDYTLKSLLNQTNRNFTLWLAFRPEDVYDHRIVALSTRLTLQGVAHALTFDWLPYHDDKFSKGFFTKVKNCARIARAAWRARRLRGMLRALFTTLFQDRNRDLTRRLSRMLDTLKVKVDARGDSVLLTRLDSDDLLERGAIQEIQSMPRQAGCLAWWNGFIFNSKTGELAEYRPDTCPPFFTLTMPGSVFWSAIQHRIFWDNFTSHEDAPKVWTVRRLKDPKYCVVIHEPRNHISSVWNHPFRGNLVGEGKEEILKRFGIVKPGASIMEDKRVCDSCGREALVPTGACFCCSYCGTTGGCS